MSTSTEHMDGLNAQTERRFYPRVSPPTAIYVAFGSNDLGVLHDISENGFRVSTPNELALNSVFRVFLSLNGAAKTIAVTVRTIWTVDGTKRSGMQLLDLADEDRAQIRQWIEFEMSRDKNSADWFMPKSGDGQLANGKRAGQNSPKRQPVNEAPSVTDGAPSEASPVSAGAASAGVAQTSGGDRRVPRIVLPTTEQAVADVSASPQPTTASHEAARNPFVAPQDTVAEPAAAEAANLPRIANPFDDPGPNPQFGQFPSVPLPIHGEFEYAAPPNASRGRRASSWRSNLRAKPLILWAVALALICFGANALVRYKISSTSRHYAAESAKYTPPKSDAAGPDSSTAVDDSGANAAAAPADMQPVAKTSSGANSASTAPSSAAPSMTSDQNDSSSAATAPARRSTARDSETTQPDPRRGSSLDSDARANRAYAATAPPNSEGSEEAAREPQPAPTPRSWSAPSPNRSASTASASDAPQTPNVQSSSNVAAQSAATPIVSQVRPAPPVTTPVQTSSTTSVVNAAPTSNSNGTVNNTPARTQPPASSQQSSTFASNANTAPPPSRPQSQIYNANTPAQHSAIMRSINQVHSSGIFDSNDSTSVATASPQPAASRGTNANVVTRPVSNTSVASAPVVSSDVPQDRDIEIPAPKGFSASWVELPGEHVVRSAAGTVHVRRLVRVPGERVPGQRWLWRGKMDVTLGDVVNRIDPAVVQASGASGSLTVTASIDKDGYVTDLKPVNGNFALLPSVSRTVRNWHYQPTYVDNKRAETQAQIEFDLRPAPVSASNRTTRQ
jgi:PilZ domain/Gram-negative bacterial TonB protein C-terminal